MAFSFKIPGPVYFYLFVLSSPGFGVGIEIGVGIKKGICMEVLFVHYSLCDFYQFKG